MTKEDIQKRIESIKDIIDDGECAHAREDDLWEEFIVFISGTNSEYAELAKEVLKTKDLDFSRWYA